MYPKIVKLTIAILLTLFGFVSWIALIFGNHTDPWVILGVFSGTLGSIVWWTKFIRNV